MPHTIPSTTVPTWNINYPITGLSTPPPGLPPLSGLLPLLSYPFLGYDLPVWLSNGCSVFDEKINKEDNALSSNHRVMIIGQDPLRVEANPGFLSIMSPWGLHYPAGFSAKHSTVYNNLIKPLLQKPSEIYVTDFWKLFVADVVDPKNTRKAISDSRRCLGRTFHPAYTGRSYTDIFKEILQKEIEEFKPISILILSSNNKVYTPIIRAISSGVNIRSAVSCSLPMTTGGRPTIAPITISRAVSSTPSIDIVCATHPNGVRTSGMSGFYSSVISLL